MPSTQKYFHDKLVLLLASSNLFLAFLCSVLIVLRVGVGQGSSDYIVQYHANLGIGAFKSGSFTDILGFVFFSFIVAITTIVLSIKTYRLHRTLSLVILSLGLFLLLMAVVVSNSLLGLR